MATRTETIIRRTSLSQTKTAHDLGDYALHVLPNELRSDIVMFVVKCPRALTEMMDMATSEHYLGHVFLRSWALLSSPLST